MKNFLKKGYYILLLIFLTLSFTACLGGDDDDPFFDDINYTDAQILTLSLAHDSFPTLKSVVFSVDQRLGLIYNKDSMDYGTDINEKVVITYTSGSGANNLLNITDGDSTWIAQEDSIDVSKALKFKSFSIDGTQTQTYLFNLNIHKVDPDSMQYKRLGSSLSFLAQKENKTLYFNELFYAFSSNNVSVTLHTSSDAVNWQEKTLNGLPGSVVVSAMMASDYGLYANTQEGDFYISYDGTDWNKINLEYPIQTFLGYLPKGPINTEGLSFIVRKEEKSVFAFTNDLLTFSYGEVVPDNFPVTEFSTIEFPYKSEQMPKIYHIGGKTASGTVKNTLWFSTDGLTWANMTDDRYLPLPALAGANAFVYDDKICVMNGQMASGAYNDSYYYSKDNGFTWLTAPDKYKSPTNYMKRKNASLIVDAKGRYVYIFGGENSTSVSDVWQMFLNGRTF